VEEAHSNRDFFQFLNKDSINYSSWHSMSHGESFLKAVSEFLPNGLYILDEPEAALSPSGIMKLMSYMNELVENGCQFIISTHSPLLMAMPNADVYQLTQEDIKKVPYKETEHYILTRQFLENPEKIFRYLFSKDE
jgi:predicted ATPase